MLVIKNLFIYERLPKIVKKSFVWQSYCKTVAKRCSFL